MRLSLSLALGIGMAVSALPAAAQVREGQTQVLPRRPDPVDTSGARLAAMRDAYRRAGSPRVVVFWNRELGDRLADSKDMVTTYNERTESGAISGVSWNGRQAAGVKASETQGEVRTGLRDSADDRTATMLSTADEWALVDAFMAEMQGAGVALVDRNVAMRALAAQDGTTDRQQGEMKGIARHGDLLMTLVQAPAAGAPLGARFRIAVTDLKSGQIVTTLVSEGRPLVGRRRLVAGADGFERERAPMATPDMVGRQLAIEMMDKLSRAWGR